MSKSKSYMSKMIHLELENLKKFIGKKKTKGNIKKVELAIETIRFHIAEDVKKFEEEKKNMKRTHAFLIKRILKLEHSTACTKIDNIVSSMY